MTATSAQFKSRIAELEAEVNRLKAVVEELTPSPKNWLEHMAKNPIFEDDHSFNEYSRIMRQLKDADRELPASPQLKRLRRDHREIIARLRKLGRFKSNLAAEEYAHREFGR